MFDKLEDLVDRLDTLNNQLTDPDIVSDQNKFRKLMKEQSELTPIVEKYKEYKDAKQTIEDSLLMLEEENDEELREMAKEELNEAKATVEKTENELKILLLPKDPNDSKNVIVEIRAGAGGEEAALFASELYRMAVDMAKEAGLEEYFMGHAQKAGFVGHGVGIEINEAPVLAPRSRDVLVSGHVIALEPKFVIPQVGGVGIEDTYLITDTGVEQLTEYPEEIAELY